jgi:hypothetical protein
VARVKTQTWAAAVLAIACAGCADDGPSYDGPSYDGNLGELAAELRVYVEVLGTPDPPTPRRIRVALEPGPSATIDQDNLCAVIEANASVNGVPLEQVQTGEYFHSSGGGGILSGYSGCEPILFERALPDELPPALLEEPVWVHIHDGAGVVSIEARGLFHPPTAHFSTPADGVMHPGDTVELVVEPSPAMLPTRLTGYYTAEVPGDSFGLSRIETSETGIFFNVTERAVSSRGSLEITGEHSAPFRALIDRCDGAVACSAIRTVCSSSHSCPTGIAYGGGFDSLILPASVVAENDD